MRSISLLLHTLKHPCSSICAFWQVLHPLHHYVVYRLQPGLVILGVGQPLLKGPLKMHPKPDAEPTFWGWWTGSEHSAWSVVMGAVLLVLNLQNLGVCGCFGLVFLRIVLWGKGGSGERKELLNPSDDRLIFLVPINVLPCFFLLNLLPYLCRKCSISLLQMKFGAFFEATTLLHIVVGHSLFLKEHLDKVRSRKLC